MAGVVSLREAFERGDEIRDLSVRPHERVALMRLLICVAQAALDGPADHEEWKTCCPRIGPSALDYLDRWQHAFELLGNGQRFLQVCHLERPAKGANSEDDEGSATGKLDLALATGNNTTLFDNSGGSARCFTPPELALMLTTFQCFSPGGRIGVALWEGQKTPGKGSSDHAPCLAGGMLHALLRGDNLVASLHKNLINPGQADQLYGRDSWGKPVWELMPKQPADADAVRNATRTYLGRLVPLTRAIRLADDGRSLTLANGMEYGSYPEDGWREPSATIVVRTIKDQPTRVVLRAFVEKALWRELGALTVKAVADKPGGPAALQNVSDDEPFDLWVGALVANKAKLVDTTESVFHVPAAMLGDPGQRTYEGGVRLAEQNEFRLRRAISEYHKQLGDKLDRPEMRTRRQQIQGRAAAQFWTEVELAVPHLLDVAENSERLGLNGNWYKTDWGKAVARAMRAAFERSCAHETPRQMRAYALGLKTLFTEPATGKSEAEGEEVEA
ncbi:MAG: type I-E CRISPR-associated protein Cse1/CasA [Acetobacteraceae bacterium]